MTQFRSRQKWWATRVGFIGLCALAIAVLAAPSVHGQAQLAAVSGAASTTWMVGDNLEADIAPAVALGMHAVWVDAERGGLPSAPPARPHRVVPAIRQPVPFAS